MPRIAPLARSRAFGGLFAVLADQRCRRLWLVGLIAGVLRWLETLAVGVYVFQITGSPSTVALMLFARMAPMFLCGLFTGALAERFDRKRLLVQGLVVLTIASLALAALAWSGGIRLWHIALGTFLGGVFWSMEFPVRRTMLGELAGREQLGAAMGLESATGNATRMVGPLFGGLLLDLAGLQGAYLLSAAGYALAALLVLRLPYRAEAQATGALRIAERVLEGLAYARRERFVLATLLVTVVVNFWGFAYVSLVPVVGERVLGLSASLTGALMSTEGFGALLGGLAFGGLARPDAYGRIYLGSSFVFLAMILLFGLSQTFPLSLAALFLSGIGIAGFATMQSTLMFLIAPPDMRSRLMGVLTVSIGMGPLGMLHVGLLADWLGASAAIAIIAAEGLLALALIAWLFPELALPGPRSQDPGETSSRAAMPNSSADGGG